MSIEQKAKTSEFAAQIGYAWTLIIRGIDYGMLDEDELPELISHLREGRDSCVDELAFDFIAGALEVRLLDEPEPAERALMIRALEQLS